MGKFIITQRSNYEYQFSLKAGNGEIILTSEGYIQKASCQKGIESVKNNAQNDYRYDRRTAVNGKEYFLLKARNGEIIGKSQLYSSKAAMESGIHSVQSNAPLAEIIDETLKKQ
ncbi:YegP family protein [Chryseobacterium gregarium]|uniref:YegP family protein n=1 Tax=Chryseobacterium gregarium TaxID=456299 RepID=UPI000423C6BC|nr:YegP family protein [Chryseobacterium gregarium]